MSGTASPVLVRSVLPSTRPKTPDVSESSAFLTWLNDTDVSQFDPARYEIDDGPPLASIT